MRMFRRSFSGVGKVTKEGLGFLSFDFELDSSGIDREEPDSLIFSHKEYSDVYD